MLLRRMYLVDSLVSLSFALVRVICVSLQHDLAFRSSKAMLDGLDALLHLTCFLISLHFFQLLIACFLSHKATFLDSPTLTQRRWERPAMRCTKLASLLT